MSDIWDIQVLLSIMDTAFFSLPDHIKFQWLGANLSILGERVPPVNLSERPSTNTVSASSDETECIVLDDGTVKERFKLGHSYTRVFAIEPIKKGQRVDIRDGYVAYPFDPNDPQRNTWNGVACSDMATGDQGWVCTR